MTEKRFKLIGDSNLEMLMQHQLELPIYDYNNKKKRLSLNDTLNLLNSLYEENEQLKQQVNCHESRIQLLFSLLDLADIIIDLCDDEKAKAFWEKRNNEVEQEWEEYLEYEGDDGE